MKKLFTLLLLTLTAFALKSFAQTTNCNAGFDVSITNLSVKFTFTASGDSVQKHNYWRFGDGAVSSDASPTHLYSSAGTYSVTHIFYRTQTGVANAVCIDSVTKRVELTVVTPPAPTCNGNFTFAISGLTVNFTPAVMATSSSTVSYWRFGDGFELADYSPVPSTVHIYSSPGSYIVTHIFYKGTDGSASCVDSVQKRLELSTAVNTCNLHAIFSYKRDSAQSNKIYFTNLSTPSADVHYTKWSFGDGTYSYDLNANHVYSTSGLYTVCLTVSASTSSSGCQKDTCMQLQVQVAPPVLCNIHPNFSWRADTANSSKIYFTSTSTDITPNTKLEWFFGDNTSSTSLNPDHIYDHAGTYNVCLKATASSICFKYECKVIEIKEPQINCNDISKFTITRSTVNCLEFKFIPVNQNPNWQYHWSFGDGTGSNDLTPSHVYQHSGNYTVYLTVYRSSTCVSTSYKIAETGTCFSCSNIWVKYEYNHTPSASGKISFHALSNAKILSQVWTITNLSVPGSAPVILNQNNPEYLFNALGEYLVCLKITTEGGCVKEYCEVVHITAPTTACTLTSYPNPAHTQITVNVQLTESQMIHAYIYNSLNVLVKQVDQQGTTGNNMVNLNVESLHAEWYTIRVVYGNKVCYSRFQKI